MHVAGRLLPFSPLSGLGEDIPNHFRQTCVLSIEADSRTHRDRWRSSPIMSPLAKTNQRTSNKLYVIKLPHESVPTRNSTVGWNGASNADIRPPQAERGVSKEVASGSPPMASRWLPHHNFGTKTQRVPAATLPASIAGIRQALAITNARSGTVRSINTKLAAPDNTDQTPPGAPRRTASSGACPDRIAETATTQEARMARMANEKRASGGVPSICNRKGQEQTISTPQISPTTAGV